MSQKIFLSFLISTVFLMLLQSPLRAQHEDTPPQSVKFLDYEFTLLNKPIEDSGKEEDCLKIFKNGKLVKEIKNYSVKITNVGYFKFKGDKKLTPYLVVSTYSGGAHCCDGIEAYELFPDLKLSFDYQGDGGAQMMSVYNKDGGGQAYILQVVDNSFLYWNTGYAGSPWITLYLQKGEKGLEVFEVANTSSVKESEILALAQSLRMQESLWIDDSPPYPRQVVEEVARLTYMNEGKLAEKFLEAAWNPKNPYKERFEKDFIELLKGNDYWHQFEKKGHKMPFQKD